MLKFMKLFGAEDGNFISPFSRELYNKEYLRAALERFFSQRLCLTRIMLSIFFMTVIVMGGEINVAQSNISMIV